MSTTLAQAIAQRSETPVNRDPEAAEREAAKIARAKKRIPDTMTQYVAGQEGILIPPERWRLHTLPQRAGYDIELQPDQPGPPPDGDVFFAGTVSLAGMISGQGWYVVIGHGPHATTENYERLVDAAIAAGMDQ